MRKRNSFQFIFNADLIWVHKSVSLSPYQTSLPLTHSKPAYPHVSMPLPIASKQAYPSPYLASLYVPLPHANKGYPSPMPTNLFLISSQPKPIPITSWPSPPPYQASPTLSYTKPAYLSPITSQPEPPNPSQPTFPHTKPAYPSPDQASLPLPHIPS
ncbi:nematocyst expressed protein 4-like [Lytechinus pictus]|uniref:nematocyst expressed protein 4-like n=1 Tax=Lytechinus pictus TaxID=7653 RepID=UPI0030BA09BB